MTDPSEPGRAPYDHPVGRTRHRIQNRILSNLRQIPGIDRVRFEETGTGIGHQVRGDIDQLVFADGAVPVEEAYVQVNWWPQPDGTENRFRIHYTDGTGFDCGWHREANAHVDGLDHYQERESATAEYEYEAVEFAADNAVGILWEVVDERLVTRLRNRYE